MKRKSNRKIKIEKSLGRKLGDTKILLDNKSTDNGLEDFILSLLESKDKTMKQAGERLALMYDTLGLILSNEYSSKKYAHMLGGNGYHLEDQVREALLLAVDQLDRWKEKGWIKTGGARVE